ncbi:MAG: PAS domain-containing sensor histidine kinase [Chloroflexi bacterium]|nr:PAS domain-containing sensor histidine kinase [Chloroflexota bacterium]
MLDRLGGESSALPPAPPAADARLRAVLGVGLTVTAAILVMLTADRDAMPDPVVLGALLFAGTVLRALVVRLPRRDLTLFAAVLLPTWLTFGTAVAGSLTFAAALISSLVRRHGLLAASMGAAAGLGGLVVGSLAGLGVETLGLSLEQPFERLLVGAAFMVGNWLGEHAIVRLAGRIEPTPATRLVPRPSLIANLLLLYPALVLVDVLTTRGPLLFASLLAVLVVALILICLYVGAETSRRSAAGEQARLQSIVAQAPDGLLAVGPDLRLEWLNDAAGRIVGIEPDAAVGRPLVDILPLIRPNGTPVDLQTAFLQAASTGRPVDVAGRYGSEGGRERPLVATFTALAEAAGTLAVGVVAIREANADDYQAFQATDLGHELRSPLTSILGHAQLLMRAPAGSLDPARQSEIVSRIASSGDYMLRLVNNLLDLRRMESGVEAVDPVPLDLSAVLLLILTMEKPRAAEKGISLSMATEEGLPIVRADELLVRRVVDNLLSNAIKYTPGGGTVRLTAVRDGDAVAIAVTDTGIGLTEEDRARLFERFFRSERPEARQERGTGLGLALVREAARRLGGEIQVRSAPGVGSTFTLRLPLEPPPGHSIEPSSGHPMGGQPTLHPASDQLPDPRAAR